VSPGPSAPQLHRLKQQVCDVCRMKQPKKPTGIPVFTTEYQHSNSHHLCSSCCGFKPPTERYSARPVSSQRGPKSLDLHETRNGFSTTSRVPPPPVNGILLLS